MNLASPLSAFFPVNSFPVNSFTVNSFTVNSFPVNSQGWIFAGIIWVGVFVFSPLGVHVNAADGPCLLDSRNSAEESSDKDEILEMGMKWETPSKAIEKSIRDLKPLLIVIQCEGDIETGSKLEAVLEDRAVQSLVSDVILLRADWVKSGDGWIWKPFPEDWSESRKSVEDSERKNLSKIFGKPKGKTVVALFDPYLNKGTPFKGSQLKASKVRKVLRATLKVCQVYSRSRKAGEQLLDQSQLLVQDQKNKDAIRLMTQLDSLKFPEREPLLERRRKLHEILEIRWKNRRSDAREMELNQKLAAAASSYEEILKEFPHPPWEKEIREDIGRVWRRIQGPGGGGK